MHFITKNKQQYLNNAKYIQSYININLENGSVHTTLCSFVEPEACKGRHNKAVI